MSNKQNKLAEIPKDANILKAFDSEKWLQWLEDILNYDIGYPFSRLTPDGDVVVDVVNYLRSNHISIYPYEVAVVITINQNANNYSNPNNVIRLLNALILIKGVFGTQALIKLIRNRSVIHVKGERDFIVTKALQAISRVSLLFDEQKEDVENHIKLQGLNDMAHDPAYIGNFLRFSYIHFDTARFFTNLTVIFSILGDKLSMLEDKELEPRYIVVIMDKINELHYRSVSNFYEQFLLWHFEIINALIENEFLQRFINSVAISLRNPNELGDYFIGNTFLGKQPHYASLLAFLTGLHSGIDKPVDHKLIIRSLAYLFLQNDPLVNMLTKILEKFSFRLKKSYRSVPFEVNLVLAEQNYPPIVHHKIIELFDEVLNTPTEYEQKFNKKSVIHIFSKMNNTNNKRSLLLAKKLKNQIDEAVAVAG